MVRRVTLQMAVDDHYVLVAIEFQIAQGRPPAHRLFVGRRYASRMGRIGETQPTEASIQRTEFVGVIGHPEIKLLIVVVVSERNAHAPLGSALVVSGNSRSTPDFCPLESTIVAKKQVRFDIIGDVQIRIAIRIEIRGENPKASQGDPRKALRRALDKSAVREILIK